MELLIQLTVVAVLLLVGLLFGRAAEKRHFQELAQKEQALRDILVFNEKRPPADQAFRHSTLVVGSVVIAED